MLVSTFELLVKRIAPLAPGGPGAPVNAPFRRVVQGYFLIITNLNPSRTANFILRFTIPALPAGAPGAFDREIVLGADANVRAGYDVAALNNQNLALVASGTTADVKTFNTRRFSIGPLQTVSVNLLPNLGNPNVLVSEGLEVRGSVELLQTYTPNELFSFSEVPATDVLLTAEIRGTFLDNDYPNNMVGTELDFDQINYGLPLASGNGRNTVEGLPGVRIIFPPVFVPSLTLDPDLFQEVRQDLIKGLNEELAPLRLAVQPLDQQSPAQEKPVPENPVLQENPA